MEVQAEEAIPEPWTLFMDGSSCLEGLGAGLILMSLEGEEFTYALRFEVNVSNNKAKYKSLVVGLRIEKQIGVKNLIAKVDSRLVANQINGLYEAKEQSMTQYMEKAKTLINNFKMFSISGQETPIVIEAEVECHSSIAYMTGVPRSIAKRRLNVRERCQPIRQKRRRQASERNKAIQEEVAKLVEAKIIRELNGKIGFSVGACHEEAEEILPSMALIPCMLTTWPRNAPSFAPNSNFLGLSFMFILLSFHQLGDFLLDRFVPFRCLPPSFLPYGLASLADVQTAFRYGSWNTGHAFAYHNGLFGYSGWIATLILFAAVGSLGDEAS
nr:reverse transcriptase domain-containing protein [Tanacetum cinerariifolium]